MRHPAGVAVALRDGGVVPDTGLALEGRHQGRGERHEQAPRAERTDHEEVVIAERLFIECEEDEERRIFHHERSRREGESLGRRRRV